MEGKGGVGGGGGGAVERRGYELSGSARSRFRGAVELR